MKTITNKTILKQGDKTYQPVEVDGVIYWVDNKPKGFSKGEWMYNEPNNDTLIYQFSYDIYPYRIGNKIIAQSQPKLEGIPVISLDSYVEELAIKESNKIIISRNGKPDRTLVSHFIKGYKSNPNQYTQKDIEKAIELTKKSAFVDAIDWDKHIVNFEETNEEILEQINSISVIEVDEHFNCINYE